MDEEKALKTSIQSQPLHRLIAKFIDLLLVAAF
jgi:hypothetical protein